MKSKSFDLYSTVAADDTICYVTNKLLSFSAVVNTYGIDLPVVNYDTIDNSVGCKVDSLLAVVFLVFEFKIEQKATDGL